MSHERGQDHDGILSGLEPMAEPKPEVKKRFFVTHVGHMTVSNYGVVEFETGGAPAVGIQPQRVIWHVDTLREINREVREAITEMRKSGEYVRHR